MQLYSHVIKQYLGSDPVATLWFLGSQQFLDLPIETDFYQTTLETLNVNLNQKMQQLDPDENNPDTFPLNIGGHCQTCGFWICPHKRKSLNS